MSKTNKTNMAHKRKKPRRFAKATQVRGLQNNCPLTSNIPPALPEYIAPSGGFTAIGKFLGLLGKPKR